MLENIRRNKGVHDKLRDNGYIHKNNSIRLKKEAQHKAVEKDDERIKQHMRLIKNKFRKEQKLGKTALQEVQNAEDEEEESISE